MRTLGSDYERRGIRERITGTAKYTDDHSFPDLLHAVLVKSPVAAGVIRSIDMSAAARVPGFVCALAGDDVKDRRYGNFHRDQPILAQKVVRYVGEPVAIVAATTQAAAIEAAAHIEVGIDPLPFVVDLEAAGEGETTQVHSGVSNVLDTARIRRGDVDAALRMAHKTVSSSITSHRVHQCYLETRIVIAMPAGNGLLLVMSTQQPFGVRSELAQLFDMPIGDIEVRVPAVGGGFGGKLHCGFAPQASALALATGRPVRLICDRAEDFQTGNPRENSIVRLTSGVDLNGIVTARRADVLLDSGAYALDIQGLTSMAAFYATGPYYIENLDLRSRGIYTNTPPTGSFRGPTGPQLVFALETHMDEIAAAIDIHPVELRRRNFITQGQRGPAGKLLGDPVTIDRCMERVLRRLEEYRADAAEEPDPRLRGYGYACTWWNSLGTPSSSLVEVHEDGSATVSSGGTEIGTGAITTTLPMIVADVLGIPASRVTLNNGGTRDAPFDSGSRGSRTLYSNGNAVIRALDGVVSQIKEEASEILGVPVDGLVLRDGRVEAVLNPNASLALADVVSSAKMRSGPVVASGRYRQAYPDLEGSTLDNARFTRLGEPTFSCHGVEVALDAETGSVEVLRYVAVQDIGSVLNPRGAIGQVEGGVVQGIGYALTEKVEVDSSGRVRNDNFHDYRAPTIADVPIEIETIFLEGNDAKLGPMGAKGIGEPPVILAAAAIASALRDVLGKAPTSLPFDAASMMVFMEGLPATTAR